MKNIERFILNESREKLMNDKLSLIVDFKENLIKNKKELQTHAFNDIILDDGMILKDIKEAKWIQKKY